MCRKLMPLLKNGARGDNLALTVSLGRCRDGRFWMVPLEIATPPPDCGEH